MSQACGYIWTVNAVITNLTLAVGRRTSECYCWIPVGVVGPMPFRELAFIIIASSASRIRVSAPYAPLDWLPGIMVHLLVTFGRYPGVYWYGVAVW